MKNCNRNISENNDTNSIENGNEIQNNSLEKKKSEKVIKQRSITAFQRQFLSLAIL